MIFEYFKRYTVDAKCSYIRYRLQSFVLEELVLRGPLTEQEFPSYMILCLDKSLLNEIGYYELKQAVISLTRLGFITATNEKIHITSEGLAFFKTGAFQNLANTSFFNYIQYRNQRSTLRASVLAVLISILSLLLSISQ